MTLHALIVTIVKELVDTPDEVRVDEVNGPEITMFEVHVAKGQYGHVIGKEGRIVNSLRTIATSVGAKSDRRVRIEVLE
jgi:predicted RNA-binding protein YlqC (UPF0109 family)